jgi:hypothetical protein
VHLVPIVALQASLPSCSHQSQTCPTGRLTTDAA